MMLNLKRLIMMITCGLTLIDVNQQYGTFWRVRAVALISVEIVPRKEILKGLAE